MFVLAHATPKFFCAVLRQGHLLSVAALALHPTKPILVTASDDKTWKMWHMPGGDLIMCGEGHKVGCWAGYAPAVTSISSALSNSTHPHPPR